MFLRFPPKLSFEISSRLQRFLEGYLIAGILNRFFLDALDSLILFIQEFLQDFSGFYFLEIIGVQGSDSGGANSAENSK